jgi:Icc-related predicted phosphoesterase
MKILALADIHGSWEVTYMIEELEGLYDFDLVMIAGDITNFGPAEFALDFLNSIHKPVFAVPGNCDPPEVIDAIEKSKAINLHDKVREFGSEKFIGLGGTNGRGFTMGITFSEDYAYSLFRNCKGCIFLTHQPPFGILDDVGGKHIGSRGIRDAIFEAKPKLVISGHVHEARGYEVIKETILVNPGPAKMGYAALVDLEKNNVEMIER